MQYITADNSPRAGDLVGFKVPTLAIVGSEDVVITVENAKAMCEYIPGARLAVVEEARHSVYWERPAEFNRRVLSFFETIKTVSAQSGAT